MSISLGVHFGLYLSFCRQDLDHDGVTCFFPNMFYVVTICNYVKHIKNISRFVSITFQYVRNADEFHN